MYSDIADQLFAGLDSGQSLVGRGHNLPAVRFDLEVQQLQLAQVGRGLPHIDFVVVFEEVGGEVSGSVGDAVGVAVG